MSSPQIYSYKHGSMVVVWCNFTSKQYWWYTHNEAVKMFKQEFGYKGKVLQKNFCPLIIN